MIQSPTARKEVERTFFDDLYSREETTADPAVRQRLLRESEAAFQRELARLVPGRRVLEIGCGIGEKSVLASELGAEVVGVDISAAAVERAELLARSCGSSAQFFQMDVERLDFPSGSFDLALDNEVFSSIDLPRAFPELARVLRPNGILLGKETLGHNPLFNLNRAWNVLRRRRSSWAAEHILRLEDLQRAHDLFPIQRVEFFHLFVLFAAPLRKIAAGAPIIHACEGLDRTVLGVPWLNRLAFKSVFTLAKGGELP